jgi:hypothetical protein
LRGKRVSIGSAPESRPVWNAIDEHAIRAQLEGALDVRSGAQPPDEEAQTSSVDGCDDARSAQPAVHIDRVDTRAGRSRGGLPRQWSQRQRRIDQPHLGPENAPALQQR